MASDALSVGTSSVLATLPPITWTVFSRLRRPGSADGVIDHLVVGPTGVFVIVSTGRAEALQATSAVAALVPSLRPDAFVPVLVGPQPVLADVVSCTPEQLVEELTGRPALLSEEWREFLTFELDMSTRQVGEPGPR